MRKTLVSGLLTLTVIAATIGGAGPAGADPAQGGEGSAFGITATLAGSTLIPPTPEASVTAPPFGDDANETLIPIPAAPLAVNATLIAQARVHHDADITPSALEVETQGLAAPYNAQAVGAAEDVEVLLDAVAADVPLIEAAAIRSEVVATCSGDTAEYSANSETVQLVIADVPDLGNAVDELLGTLFPALDPLADLIDVDENVITELPDGLAVDALVVTVLNAAAPGVGLVQVRIGHAELSGVVCGPDGDVPECSDNVDNDDDSVIDEDDPGCHDDGDADNPDSYNPDDDDESDIPECSDGIDNDGDGQIDFPDDDGCDSPDDDDESDDCSDGIDNDGDDVIDIDDPGCHSDGNANNPDSYDPNDDSEADVMPRTGGAMPTALATGLGLAAMAMFALRRRALA